MPACAVLALKSTLKQRQKKEEWMEGLQLKVMKIILKTDKKRHGKNQMLIKLLWRK